MAKQPKVEAQEKAELEHSAEPLVLPKPVIKQENEKKNEPKKAELEQDHKAPTVSAKVLFKMLSTSSEQGRMVRLVELSRSNSDVKWLLEEFNKTKS